MSSPDKFRGCLLGLAVGDALGTTLENTKEVSIPLTDMIGGGPFGLVAGEFTDDTSTALLLGESLIANHGFSATDQLNRYYDWYTQGHLGANNECFDIGIGTRKAVLAYKETGIAYPNGEDETRAGNGSLMRLAPIALAYNNQNPEHLLGLAVLSSRTTHTAVACSDACKLYVCLIAGALHGLSKEELLKPDFFTTFTGRPISSFCPEILAIVEGSYKTKSASEIIGGGYVVHALETALFGFFSTDSFESGALKVANLGNDADTTTCIYGQLAGAFYGEQGIPESWREKLAFLPFITAMANELYRKSSSVGCMSSFVSDSRGGPNNDVVQTGFSVIPDQPALDTSISQEYSDTHACLLKLEEGWASVKRRLEPGPNQFQSVENLDSAVTAFTETYQSEAPECTSKGLLLHDWIDRIVKTKRAALLLKLAKPKIVLPFGAGLKKAIK